MDGAYAADARGAFVRGVRVDAWYCWTLTYILMIVATVGMRVARQPAAAEVGGGRSQSHPIRSVEQPAAGHRSVVQGASEERVGSSRHVSRHVTSRHVTSRQSRVGPNRVINSMGSVIPAVVGLEVGYGVGVGCE